MDSQKSSSDLIGLLEGGKAHLPVKDLVKSLAFESACIRPEGMKHSIYELLEHLRIAQEDIYRYTVDPSWESPPWPAGYWPEDNDTLDQKRWNRTIDGFLRDLETVINWVRTGSLKWTDKIPHGEGRTYLRQVLLVADHNAYHLGQIVLIRNLLTG
jgi:hypothetical protein